MEAGFRELRGDGIGKLVGLATPDNHGIAMHYSYPSIHGTWIVDGKVKEEVSYNTSASFDRFNENRDGWVKALKDSGLQFDFISYGDVEQGGAHLEGLQDLRPAHERGAQRQGSGSHPRVRPSRRHGHRRRPHRDHGRALRVPRATEPCWMSSGSRPPKATEKPSSPERAGR